MSLFPQVKPQLPREPDIALAVGHAPWWIPQQTTRKKINTIRFSLAFRDFLRHVSLHCYGKLVEPGRRFAEKFFWLIFHVIALAVLILFLWQSRDDNGQLLSTNIYDALYPVQKVAFPAISICSVNRISNASATKYAQELNSKDPLKRGVNYFYNEIILLSYNYLRIGVDVNYERALEFQRFLDIFDTEDNELFYNTRRRMEMLTPLCKDILVKCHLGGKEFNCAEEFIDTMTQNGLCCTFNYDGKYSGVRSAKQRFFGPDKGLVVHLNGSQNDYYYRQSRMHGFNINIYTPGDFPEVFSGSVRERTVQTGVDSFISLIPTVLKTVKDARYLSPKTRKCRFEDEMPNVFGKAYSFNKCITRCRLFSILVLCQCLLFYAPQQYLDASTDTVWCTLQHKACLKRYDFKWLNVITQRQYVRGLEREMEDALYCPDCLPSCSETRYTLSAMALPLTPFSHSIRNLSPDSIKSNTSLALLRVYFRNPHALYLKQLIKRNWFEFFSKIGSICGIITGFSLIGICEVLFFLCRYLLSVLKDEIRSERKPKVEVPNALLILP